MNSASSSLERELVPSGGRDCKPARSVASISRSRAFIRRWSARDWRTRRRDRPWWTAVVAARFDGSADAKFIQFRQHADAATPPARRRPATIGTPRRVRTRAAQADIETSCCSVSRCVSAAATSFSLALTTLGISSRCVAMPYCRPAL